MPVASVVAGNKITVTWGNSVATFAGLFDETSTTFTPTWTNVTLTSATNQGRYAQVGPIVVIEYFLQFGASTAFTSTVFVDMPVAALSTFFTGAATYQDVGTRDWVGAVRPTDTNTVAFAHSESGNTGLVNATNPFTWANGDVLRSTFVYLAA